MAPMNLRGSHLEALNRANPSALAFILVILPPSTPVSLIFNYKEINKGAKCQGFTKVKLENSKRSFELA